MAREKSVIRLTVSGSRVCYDNIAHISGLYTKQKVMSKSRNKQPAYTNRYAQFETSSRREWVALNGVNTATLIFPQSTSVFMKVLCWSLKGYIFRDKSNFKPHFIVFHTYNGGYFCGYREIPYIRHLALLCCTIWGNWNCSWRITISRTPAQFSSQTIFIEHIQIYLNEIFLRSM